MTWRDLYGDTVTRIDAGLSIALAALMLAVAALGLLGGIIALAWMTLVEREPFAIIAVCIAAIIFGGPALIATARWRRQRRGGGRA